MSMKQVGLYWIDDNGYYHYPERDRFEFGQENAKTEGALQALDNKIKDISTTAENEYNAGYDAGWQANKANAKAGLILGFGTLGTIATVAIVSAVLDYKSRKKEN